ncbi:MAG: 7TM diverse intracellular signaling domain-containing protein [Oligoflexus sp.]
MQIIRVIILISYAFAGLAPAMARSVDLVEGKIDGINIVPFVEISDPVPDEVHPTRSKLYLNFKSVDTKAILLGLSSDSYWIKFKLNNTTTEVRDIFISSSNPSIDYLTLYQADSAGEIKELQTIGDKIPYPDYLLPSRFPYFKIKLRPGETLYYIKVSTKDSTQLTLRVWSERQFIWAFSIQNIIYSLLFGGFAIISIYNLILYYSFRHPAFVIYVAYIVTNVVFLAGTQGYNYHVFAPNASVIMQNEGMLFFDVLAGILVVFYSMSFLNVRRQMPKLQFLGWVPLVVGFVGLPICFFSYRWTAQLVLINTVFITLVSLIWGILSCVRGYRPAYYYTFAWSLFFAGSLYQAAGTWGIIDTGEIALWGQVIGFSLQVVFQSGALAEKIVFIKDQAMKKHEDARKMISEMNIDLERRVQEKTENIKLILENVNQGLFTIGGSPPRIQEDYSKSLVALFNEGEPMGKDPVEYVFSKSDCSTDTIAMIQNIVEISINESIINFTSNSSKLPKQVNIVDGGVTRYYRLDWLPIADANDDVSRILVSVRDDTQELEVEELRKKSTRDFELIKELLEIPAEKWASFKESCSNLLDDCLYRIEQDSLSKDDVPMIFINIHTLKGIARTFNLTYMVNDIHYAESYLTAINKGEVPIDHNKIVELVKLIAERFHEYRTLGEEKLGRQGNMSGFTTIELAYLRQMLAGLIRLDSNSMSLDDAVIVEEVCESLGDICYTRLSNLLTDIVQSSEQLAKKLGKLPPLFEFEDSGLYLNESCHHLLIAVFTHLIRNSLDHGIETASERLAAGKSPRGKINFVLQEDQQGLKIILRDDGRGLHLEKIRSKGLKEGKISTETELTDKVVTDIIFSSGFSTAETVSDISGRGVGLEAVRKYLSMHHASIELQIERSEETGKMGRSFASVISLGKEHYIRNLHN